MPELAAKVKLRMSIVSKIAKPLIRKLAGIDVERVGRRTYFLMHESESDPAWFSWSRTVRALLEDLRVDLVLDVGANSGQFGRRLRNFYAGELHSFEPVSSCFARLEQASAGDDCWHAHKLALGDEVKTATINIAGFSQFNSFLAPNDYALNRFGSFVERTAQEEVSVRRLDEWLRELTAGAGRRIFLKMDTQGSDSQVFAGLGEALPQVVALQSEVSLVPIYDAMPHWTESLANYEAPGFGVVGMYPVTRDEGLVVEYDCLMRRR